jgi:hypothetical protein
MSRGPAERSRVALAALVAIGLVVIAFVGVQTASACSHRCHRIRINAGTHQAVKPHRLLSLSGDGAFYVTKLHHWRHWNHHRAAARGKAHLNDCMPSCAEGTFSTYHAIVRVSRPVNCRGGRKSYSKVLVRFNGRHIREHWPRAFACQ